MSRRLHLRHLLGVALLLAALLPAAVVSVMLLEQHFATLQSKSTQEMERTLNSMTDDIRFKFSIFANNLQLFSRDRLMVQALDNFLLTGHAFNALKSLIEQAPLVSAVYLLDPNMLVVEEYGGNISALEEGPLGTQLRQAEQLGRILDSRQLLLPFHDARLAGAEDHPETGNGIAVVVPIYRHTSREGVTRAAEGYLLAIISWTGIYSALQSHLKEREQLAVMRDGQLIASPNDGPFKPDADDNIVATHPLTISSTYSDQELEYTLMMQVSRSARSGDEAQARLSVSITIGLMLAAAGLAAWALMRRLTTPFNRLRALIEEFGRGNYHNDDQPLSFAEFEEVRLLMKQMADTIHAQLNSLREQNLALEAANSEKEEFNRRLLSFNDELEQRVIEKTGALSESLRREEKSRQILQALLHVGVELQQESDGELESAAVVELRHLYPEYPLAMLVRGPQGISPQVQAGLEDICIDWLSNQLLHAIDDSHSLASELRFGNRTFQTFTMYSSNNNKLGILAIQANTLDFGTRDIMRLFCKQLAAIIEGRLLNAELGRMAHTDSLTNLANRKAFDEAIGHASAMLTRYPENPFGLFIIDANGLKETNDRFGHAAGDLLLTSIAEILTKLSRKTDRIFRLGGDEFAILVTGGDEQSCRLLAKRLAAEQNHHQLALPNVAGQVNLLISFAFGYASTEEIPPAQLFREADSRMYSAKQQHYQEHQRYERH